MEFSSGKFANVAIIRGGEVGCSGDGLDGRFGPHRNFSSGELFYLGEKAGIEAEAELGEFGELRKVLRVVGGEHAGRGPRGFGHGATALEYDDAESMAGNGRSGKIEGEGESDDSRASDDYISSFHASIVCWLC